LGQCLPTEENEAKAIFWKIVFLSAARPAIDIRLYTFNRNDHKEAVRGSITNNFLILPPLNHLPCQITY
jgi:hypothetical protein